MAGFTKHAHLGLAAAVLGLAAGPVAAQALNLYSSRHYDTDYALYQNFTAENGATVNLIEAGSDALIERVVAEGANSPADVLITVDAGRLWRADEAGLFQPVQSAVLEERIPAHLRHPDGHWFGFSKRARVIVYNLANGAPEGLTTYEGLADPAYAGQLCIRSSTNIYNLSLMASLIHHHGEEVAQAWAEGVVANFARPPQGNDTAQIRAVAAGECDLALVNTYYVGRLRASDDADDRAVGESIGIVFPNQEDRGTHVNISGAGLLTTAPNAEAGLAFLEYLASDGAQRLFAEGNNEYAVVAGIEVDSPITAFGEFKEDTLDPTVLGELQAAALQVYDRAGWR